MVFFNISLGYVEKIVMKELVPLMIWISCLLVCVLNVENIFKDDYEDGSLEIFLIDDKNLEINVMANVLSHWLLSNFPIIFFDLHQRNIPEFIKLHIKKRCLYIDLNKYKYISLDDIYDQISNFKFDFSSLDKFSISNDNLNNNQIKVLNNYFEKIKKNTLELHIAHNEGNYFASRKTLENLEEKKSTEIILYTSKTGEGEATAHYVQQLASKINIKVSRIAFGIPLNGELGYLDSETISHAFNERKII